MRKSVYLCRYEPSSSEDEVKLKPIHKRLRYVLFTMLLHLLSILLYNLCVFIRWDSSSEDEGLKIKQMEHSPIK